MYSTNEIVNFGRHVYPTPLEIYSQRYDVQSWLFSFPSREFSSHIHTYSYSVSTTHRVKENRAFTYNIVKVKIVKVALVFVIDF